jgi:RNA polymerase-binding transcription factor DksA
MTAGWAKDGEGKVPENTEVTAKDAKGRLQSPLQRDLGLVRCAECGAEMSERHQEATSTARLCISCQEGQDQDIARFCGYRRRGNKDTQTAK